MPDSIPYHQRHKVSLPEGRSGPWSVEAFEVGKPEADFERMRALFSSAAGRGVPEGKYTRLCRNGTVIMSDTPDEIRDHLGPIRQATGHCLVNGLGLGMVAAAMLEKPEVLSVTAVEISEDVVRLVGDPLAGRYGDRLQLVTADAYEWQPPKGARYGAVWHDIWDNLCTDNLPQMTRLHRKYGRLCDWQGSWGEELLSAREEERAEMALTPCRVGGASEVAPNECRRPSTNGAGGRN